MCWPTEPNEAAPSGVGSFNKIPVPCIPVVKDLMKAQQAAET